MVAYESARQKLEELELIENAISARFKRNPELFYRNVDQWKAMSMEWIFPEESPVSKTENKLYTVKKPKRSRKQMAAQEHEIALFLETYRKNCDQLVNLEFEDASKYRVSEGSIDEFLREVESIGDEADEAGDIYAMFSNSTSSSKDVLSRKAQDLDVNALFSRDEQYGEVLDLTPFHQQWLGVVKSGDVTFLQFLSQIEKFRTKEFLTHPGSNRNSGAYRHFISTLCDYVDGFSRRAYPVLDWRSVDAKVDAEFRTYLAEPLIDDHSKSFYCIPCDKHFKAHTVYSAHLTGKKHLGNLRKNEQFLAKEHKLHKACEFLAQELSRTREFVERKLGFTSEERQAELERITANYEAPVYNASEPEEHVADVTVAETQSNLDSAPDLPLGPDGFPIPHWLYKLQGLDIEYRCELCGNHAYKGRRQFDKHFAEPLHTSGLRKLGVEPSTTFQGLTTIADVQKLASNLQTRGSGVVARSGANKMDIEVEDQHGNVMTQRMYDELDKQGLL
ncbi:LAFA_0F03994g1_1 [Lachancea sp. 'fantastica']|nr:LAFA_0F03994g1_1 [Lachancea sp. 'fantastica']